MRIENSFILIPGFGEKTEQKLWKNNITHWDHVEETDFISDNKRQKAQEFLQKARKNLEVNNSLFFGSKLGSKRLWRLYRNFEENACFYDIETTGLDQKKNKVTTVSFHRNGEDVTLVRGEDLTRENLEREFFKSDLLVTFNGKRFDQPFLEHNYDLNIKTPHIDLMYPCKRLGMTGGLKQIEKDIGIERELEDLDGREAIRLWKKYEKNGDQEALNKLVKYNRYDARNLEQLLDIVHSKMKKQVFEPHRSYNPETES